MEVWREFGPKISVIFNNFIESWYSKAFTVIVTLIIVCCDILPGWLVVVFSVIIAIMIWSFFTGRKTSYQPAKRPFSVSTNYNSQINLSERYTLNNSQQQPPIYNSNSGSSPFIVENDHHQHHSSHNNYDEDELDTSSTASTVDHQHHHHREPLDAVTLSAVTSPGFTSRLARRTQPSLNPLRECNVGNLSISPSGSRFKNSPTNHLKLGQLPGPSWKAQSNLTPPSFPSPVNTARFSLTRRKKNQVGTTYVHFAPVDVVKKATTSTTTALPKASDGSIPGGTSSIGVGDNSRSMFGLGGFHPSPPTSGMTNSRMQKLWSPPMILDTSSSNSQLTNTEAGPSSSPPCSISDTMFSRKRNRLPDVMLDSRTSPVTRHGSHSYLQEDHLKQNSKRTKYIQSPSDLRFGTAANRNLPFMALPNLQTHDDESMTSESILEQMNQTEKRFLPDDDTISPSKNVKKSKISVGSSSKGSSSGRTPSPYRKRRVPDQLITSMEEEDETEKNRGFCSCSECYNDAAGSDHNMSIGSTSSSPNTSSPGASKKKKKNVTFEDRSSPSLDDGKNITANAKSDECQFRSTRNKSSLVPNVHVITKADYDIDKQRRLDRLNRILSESYRSKYPFHFTKNLSPVPTSSSPTSVKSQDNSNLLETTTSSSSSSTSNGNATNLTSQQSPIMSTSAAPSSLFSFGQSSPDRPSATPSVTVTTASSSMSSTSSPPSSGFSVISSLDKGPTATITTTTASLSMPSPSSGFPIVSAFGQDKGPTTSTIFGQPAPSNLSTPLSAGQSVSPRPLATTTTSSPTVGTSLASPVTFGQDKAAEKSGIPQGLFTTPTGSPTILFGQGNLEKPLSSSSSNNNNNLSTTITAPGTEAAVSSLQRSININTFAFGPGKSETTTSSTSSIFGTISTPTTSTITQNQYTINNKDNTNTPGKTISTPNFGGVSLQSGTVINIVSQEPIKKDSKSTDIIPILGQTPIAVPSNEKEESSNASLNKSSNLFSFGGQTTTSTTSLAPTLGTLPPVTTSTTGGFPFTFGQKDDQNAATATSPFGSQANSAKPPPPLFGQVSTSQIVPTFGGTQSTPASDSMPKFGQVTSGSSTPTFGQSNTGAFNQSSNNTSSSTVSIFGAAAPNNNSSGTSTPTFGQSNNNNTGATSSTAPTFGQVSSTSASSPTFGQGLNSKGGLSGTTSFGQGGGVTSSTNVFGQPSTGGGGSGFTLTNSGTFGQSNTISSPSNVGPSQGTPASIFGQGSPNKFGLSNLGATATTTTSPFGGQGSLGTGGIGGSSPFGGGTSGSSAMSPFGQSSSSSSSAHIFGQTSSTATSPFGSQVSSVATTSPFGGLSSSSQSGTGITSSFGQQSSPASGLFGQPNAGAIPTTTTFGQASSGTTTSGGGGFTFGSNNNAGNQGFGQSTAGTTTSGNTTFGSAGNKPVLFGQSTPATGNTFTFGQSQAAPTSAPSFNFNAASSTTGNLAASPFGGGGGFSSPQSQTGGLNFGTQPISNEPSQQPASIFQFGQSQQQPQAPQQQGGFNFNQQQQQQPFGAGQPQQQQPFGAQQQQQQQPMFNLGSASSSARRREPRTRRFR